ncbi:MAG TPA: DUF364 domain-containing protein [Syntrophorhabdaceae bacterium]|nr:DUF364 domain-containing protein [Syntrophorhabdaceae bacterium]
MEILQRIISRIGIDAPVKEVRKGVFWTAVVSRFCGLSSTMLKEHCMDEDIDETVPASFTDMTALELAHFSLSNDISKASLGLAAINSLTEIDESRCVEVNAGSLLLKKGTGKNISVIGHFPFTNDLRNVAKNLWVIEKRQRPGDYPEDNAGQYLPQSDIVAISSTTLINHTLPGLLRLCPEKSMKMLLGPTTPMSPVLFDYGVDIISGSRVTDDGVALKHISEGANFRQLKRTGAIKLITMIRTGKYLV